MKQFNQDRMSHKMTVTRLLFLFAIIALLGGCATRPTYMIPTAFDTVKRHPQTVSVNVSGVFETEAAEGQTSDSPFSQALVEAINKSQTFSRVIEGDKADYLLTVVLFNMEKPAFGLTYTVKMEAGWTLQRANTRATVWQESIKSEHTSTFGDAFAAVARMRMAMEGAVRDNISQGLSRISRLNL